MFDVINYSKTIRLVMHKQGPQLATSVLYPNANLGICLIAREIPSEGLSLGPDSVRGSGCHIQNPSEGSQG